MTQQTGEPRLKNLSLINRNFQDLNPLACGWEKCEGQHHYGPAARDFYLIHYIVSGRGFFRRQGQTYHLEATQAFLISPGEITYYEADDQDPWTYIWIGFNGGLSSELVQKSQLDSDHCIINDVRIGRVFMAIRSEAESGQQLELYLAGKLFELFSVLQKKPDWLTCQQIYVTRTMDYINANYERPISIASIAQIVGIDRHYLCRLFFSETGQTPRGYLNQVRLQRAAEYLSTRKYSIQETAYSVGYLDAFTFSKAFKRHFGVSPSHYRQENG